MSRTASSGMEEHRELWWPSPTLQLGRVVSLDLAEPFTAAYGGRLPSIQVSYESWGNLSRDRDNAVLIAHPLTADCHATGEFAGQEMGWWEPLIGPGRAIDTERDFVVCPNLIGGCYGTTGPRFPDPDGVPYMDRFPLLAPRDMMRVQRLFLQALGIDRLRMVIGPSMGGMIAWEWAVEDPEMAGRVVVVAAPLRSSPHQIGLNWLQRRGIELDITGNEVVAKVGQMLARGVGMLSYRSPVGLEVKFGREWFKEPGSTLGDRGMYNVESWLRHHGRRITKRFDPYTYLLYSRAMDLHDVSHGRGDLIQALERVSCPVLVIGISSDNLYPRAEVHLGADILNHLGKDVRFREIRSPNGHDGFLLDTDQISRFLRDMHLGRRRPALAPSEREVRPVQVGVLGAGRVAASFVRLVRERRDQIAGRNGLELTIAGVAEIDREKTPGPEFHEIEISRDPDSFVARAELDVVVDLTRGTSVRGAVERALRRGRPVVTPNKMLLRAHGEELGRLALENGVRLAYHDSIAAGWPLVHALERPLAQGGVTSIRAVLSSAVNVMLEAIESGATLQEATGKAIDRDLTEPDPALDISGWDSAQKLTLLLTRITGRRYVGQVPERIGIDEISPSLVREAPSLDLRIKLVALAVHLRGEPRAAVRPMAVSRDSHLGLVRGEDNVVVIESEAAGEMVFLGSGGGALPVAIAVLNDLIGVFDPVMSWTGRFPAAERALLLPRFEEWLVPSPGGPVRSAEPGPGGVPVLRVVEVDEGGE